VAEAPAPLVAVRAAAGVDLTPLTDRLWRERIPHRVVGDGNGQVVLVLDETAAARVQAMASALARGDTRIPGDELPDESTWQTWWRTARRFFVRTPVTALVVLVTLGLAPFAIEGRPVPLLAALFMVPPAWVSTGAEWSHLGAVLLRGEVWRLLTPCLLHFSLLHLAMDVVLFSMLGRRIERGLGTLAAVATFCGIGVLSNVAQFLLAGSALFGGLSGVVMGQLGFLLLTARRSRNALLRVEPALAIGMLVSSAIFATGITELVGLHIANTAHWAGFAVGVLAGALWPLRGRAAR
jgi:GlpG protein